MSDNTEKTIEDLLWIDAMEDEQSREAEMAAKKAAQNRLEERYANHGLKFTQGFSGACPVQAFGEIDGMRFYFRFRHDTATLDIGENDPELPELIYASSLARYNKRIAVVRKDIEAGKFTEEEAKREFLFAFEPRLNLPNGIDDYPTLLKKRSFIANYSGDDLNGFLDGKEAEEVFSRLIDSLEDCDIDTHENFKKTVAEEQA